MSIADEIGGILKQYQTGATPAPAAVNAHFDQVASAVPANVLADGLAHAMTSSQTPPLGQIVSALFNQANPAQKAGVLDQLMTVLGPAAVAAATGGALGAGAGPARLSHLNKRSRCRPPRSPNSRTARRLPTVRS